MKDFQILHQGKNESTWYEQKLPEVFSNPWFSAYISALSTVRVQRGLRDPLPNSRYFLDGDGGLEWAYVSFNSTLPARALPFEEISPHFEDWEEWTDNQLTELRGFQTNALWDWMVTQKALLTSVFSSVGTCLAFALVVLAIASTNWIIAILCVVCIVAILCTFALAIVCAGWALGIFEAIGLIVVVGLSVDYTVHLGHSYNECRVVDGKDASREDRTQHALTEMGISVVSGAGTTFLAAVFLVFTSFTFYFFRRLYDDDGCLEFGRIIDAAASSPCNCGSREVAR